MSNDRLAAEQEAVRSLLDLMDKADHTRQLYERLGMAIPEPLRRILGMVDDGAKAPKVMASVPAPSRRQPADAKSGWVSVEAKSAGPPILALAVLREVGSSVRARDVAQRVIELLPSTTSGTVANAGTKLDADGAIKRGDDGWTLRDADKAPILFEGRLWGPPSIFGKYELAAHRRDAILHLLHAFQSGLQTSQIIEQLRACPWVHAPISKEMVQDDIEILVSEKRIRRRGPSKKWELAPEEGRTKKNVQS